MRSGPKPRPRLRRATIWSTASLRLAAAFALLSALAGAIFVATVDYALIRFVESETREGLRHQFEVMLQDAERLGSAGLVAELNLNPNNLDARRYVFLVEAPGGEVFTNGLAASAVSDTGFRHNLPTGARPPRWPDQTPDMLVFGGRAPDGGLLAVGRDTRHIAELRSAISGFAILIGLALLALTLAGGLAAGGLFLRRLDAVNRSIAKIMAGKQNERLPPIGFGREFDELAGNLNGMLERQERAMAALKTLSEGVAHELRAPLNRLRNWLEEIEGLADPKVREAVGRATQETEELNALFASLLSLSRVETGAANLDRRRIDVREIIGTIGEIYAPVVEEVGGTLTTVSSGGAPLMIEADTNLIHQALANLIENAVFHAGAQPAIILASREDEHGIELSVSDNGRGIPADEYDKVVRRFYRLSGDKAQSGAGLGLAMVSAVAEAHGGRLVLSDAAPGLKAALWLPRGEDAI